MFPQLIRYAGYFGPSLVLVVFVTGLFVFRPQVSQPAVPAIPEWNFSAPEPGLKNSSRNVQTHITLRDPFNSHSPSSSSMSLVPEPELNMIVRSGASQCCMINGKLYNLNDKGPGFHVKAIERGSVVIVKDDGSTTRLFLNIPGSTADSAKEMP